MFSMLAPNECPLAALTANLKFSGRVSGVETADVICPLGQAVLLCHPEGVPDGGVLLLDVARASLWARGVLQASFPLFPSG